MNRREAVGGATVSAVMIMLTFLMTGCRGTPKVHITPGSPEAHSLLAAISDAVAPPAEGAKDSGARAVDTNNYLQRVIDDTLVPAERLKVYTQLQALEDECEAAFELSFANADRMEREAVLLKFAGSPDKSDREFFGMLKQEAIKGKQKE